MRFPMFSVLLLASGFGSAAAQTARCQLSPRPYGLGGTCRLDRGEAGAGGTQRLPFSDSVRIWMTSGPRDQPPWRGNLSLPRLETSFEIAHEAVGPGPGRLVFRTGIVWLLVKEWREIEGAPEGCSACDRSATMVSLVLDLVSPPPATQDDIVILQSALARLETGIQWNRQEQQTCGTTNGAGMGLFCLLYTSVESRMGRYHHRQPALEIVRSVILARWRERITSHQLVDFNNHPETTLADLRSVLALALERARGQSRPEKE